MKSLAQEKVNRFLNYHPDPQSYRKFIDQFNQEFDSLNTAHDQIIFLTKIAEQIEVDRLEHEKKCTQKINCHTEYGYLEINHHFQHLLSQLGIPNDNQFTSEERSIIVEQFDNLVKAYEAMGQEVEALKVELNDLKNHFYLGKKRWRQFSKGKYGEMVISGLVSEAVSKPIFDYINENVPMLGY